MLIVELELMTDVDTYQSIEKSMRGGVSIITQRYGKGNNKYLVLYDKSNSYLLR